MNRLLQKFGDWFTKYLNDGGGYVVFAIAIIAIIFACIGFYGTHTFDWTWFLCLYLPLYLFCIWALWQAFKMYQDTLKNRDK